MAADHQAIHAIADRLAPGVRREFLAAVQRLKARISIAELARAIERGGLTVQLTGAFEQWPADLRRAVSVVNTVFAQVGAAAAQQLPAHLRTVTSFDITNPFAVEAARLRTAFLVREVSRHTVLALQGVITRAFREGLPPREAARLIRPLIGLTARQSMAVFNFRDGLVAQGLSASRVTKAVDRYAAQLLQRRAVMIARTETIRAATDGQLALWRQAQQDGLLGDGVRKRWVVTPDDRLCPECEPLHGVERLLHETFPNGVMGPPLHPQCRCALVLSRTSLRQQGAA